MQQCKEFLIVLFFQTETPPPVALGMMSEMRHSQEVPVRGTWSAQASAPSSCFHAALWIFEGLLFLLIEVRVLVSRACFLFFSSFYLEGLNYLSLPSP